MRTPTPQTNPSTAQTPLSSQTAQLATPTIIASDQPISTLAPATVEPIPSSIPATVVIGQPQPRPTPTNAERWRAEQLDRQPLELERTYVAPQSTALF